MGIKVGALWLLDAALTGWGWGVGAEGERHARRGGRKKLGGLCWGQWYVVNGGRCWVLKKQGEECGEEEEGTMNT